MLSSKRIKIFSNFYQKILHECKTFEEYLDIQNNHYNQFKININNINTTNKSINLTILFTRKTSNKQKLLYIGITEERSIASVVNLVCKNLDYDGEIIWDKTKPAGQFKKPSSNDKLISTGWSASSYTSFEVSGQSYEVNTKSDSNFDGDMIHVNALN